VELFDYQKAAVDQIVTNGGTYLGYEMGLGKSAIAIETARRLGIRRLAVFCPSVGKLTWKKEFKRWWPKMPVHLINSWQDVTAMNADGAYIISYNRISMSKSSGYDYVLGIKKNMTRPFEMTVLDEAHYLKNPKSIRTKAVLHTLRPLLGRCLPMSGTPAPNHAGELYPVLATLFPDAIKKRDGAPMKIYEFENAFCDVKQKWFGGRQVRVIEGSKNLDDLRQRMAPFMMRKKKSEVLKDLPEMSFDTYPIDAPGAPQWGVGHLDDEALLHDEHVMKMRRQLGLAKVRGAVDAIDTMLEGCTRKALVFAHHTDVIDGLMQGLGDWNPVKLDGRDPPPARERAIATFLGHPECRVFIGNIQAAGTTITLVGPGCNVSDVFFVESSFSPGDNVQAASRIHRIGQKDAVQVWFLSADGTYDDRIAEINARKARDFKELFG
jgi:SWI/SNF-related matrix-associated actin-dependent regulator of chromatin subfamily A-like protein 1